MEKVLNQEEIDAMVRAARSGEPSPQLSQLEHAEPWDVRQAGQIGREQLKAITQLHEVFARSLTHSLGAYLRVVFSATLVSAEHLTFREFLQRIPEMTYLASCRLNPMGINAALQIDLKVAFPIIDLLLGGVGAGMPASREITEIEEQILDSVARIVCRELGAAWQSLTLDVLFEAHLDTPSAQRLMPPEEKTLCLSFEIQMADTRGNLNLAIPVTVSNALLRKIADSWSHRRSAGNPQVRQRLMNRLLDCPFEAELGAQDIPIPLGALAQAVIGDVLTFSRDAFEPASLVIDNFEVCRAVPARCGSRRAVRVASMPTLHLERANGANS